MSGRSFAIVVVTVVLLALGAVAGARFGPKAPPRDDGERLAALERQVADLAASQDALTRSLEPATEFLEFVQETTKARGGIRGHLLEARLAANETAAIATLRNIVAAQAQFQMSAKADVDNDGEGEYGGFAELSGAKPGRMLSRLDPEVLSGAFRVLGADGEVTRSGYHFRIYLPSPSPAGVGVAEPQQGFATDGAVDPDLAEKAWCGYAWPALHSESGTRTFFTNQAGDTLATDDPVYSGEGGAPEADAAFVTAAVGTITGEAAVDEAGNDGNTWRQIN